MRVRIYDTEGQLRYGRSEDDQRNRFVSEVYRNAKLRFLVDTRGDSFRVLCYVRAVESEGQRSEQFYVGMVSDTPVELSEFKREAVGALRKVFHEIDLSNPTTNVFEYLDANIDVSGYLPEDDLHAVRSLADQGERLDFGAGDQRAALSVAKALGDVPAKVVIADAGRTEYYDDAEVVLDTGYDGDGITASKDTTEKIQRYLGRQSKGAAEEKIESIGKQAKELKEIKREEGLTDSEVDKPLRNALKTQFPGIFRTETPSEKTTEKKKRQKTSTTKSKTTEPETTTKPADVSPDAEDSEKGGFIDSVPTKALGGILVIGIIGALVAGAAVSGFSLSDVINDIGGDDNGGENGGNESGGDGGENSAPVTFADVLINGEEWEDYEVPEDIETLEVSGELNGANDSDETVNATLSNGSSPLPKSSTTSTGFSFGFSKEEVRGELGYSNYIGDDALMLNLTGENINDSRGAEIEWDTQLPPELTVYNGNKTTDSGKTTVQFTVRNRGNRTGAWTVSLNNSTSSINTTSIDNLEGNSEQNENLSVSDDYSVEEITCSKDSDGATCSEDFPYSDF